MSNERNSARGVWRIVLLLVVTAMTVAACSGSDDAGPVEPTTGPDIGSKEYDSGESGQALSPGVGGDDAVGVEGQVARFAADGSIVFQNIGPTAIDAKVIRDGRIDVRIDEGSFDAKGAELRAIAAEFGGYVASGESHVEEHGDNRYAVGWFTLKVPSDRFEDAVDRVERLGARVSSSLSSQDVTEEYVDLEGRLNYWEQQEAFYTNLLTRAETIEDLVTIQSRMQDVLLNIEQIEGRLRYLDGRTAFATLTVGLTEVPDAVAPIVPDNTEPGPIAEAFEQAGEVLLATVAFLIVATAVIIPLGILAIVIWLIIRLMTPRKKDQVVVDV